MAPFRALWMMWRRTRSLYWLGKSQLLYKHLLGGLGAGTRIIRPLELADPRYIHLGDHVTVNRSCWLGAYRRSGEKPPRLAIGNGCQIGHFNHITCIDSVEIGEKVLTADRVHISDNMHAFDDPHLPIMDQEVVSRGPVVIGAGTWLGENVSVLSARIGRNCVIGANAVVTTDIPDFSVAVGVPARVIKRYDLETERWESIEIAR